MEGLTEVGRTAGSPGLGRGDSSRARGTGEPPGPAPQRCRGAQRPRSERGPQHPWVGLSPQMVLASSELPPALCVGTGNHHVSEMARVWGDEASSGHGGLTETLRVLQTSYKPVSTPGAGSVPRERRNPSDREGMCPQLSRKWALGVINQLGLQKSGSFPPRSLLEWGSHMALDHPPGFSTCFSPDSLP